MHSDSPSQRLMAIAVEREKLLKLRVEVAALKCLIAFGAADAKGVAQQQCKFECLATGVRCGCGLAEGGGLHPSDHRHEVSVSENALSPKCTKDFCDRQRKHQAVGLYGLIGCRCGKCFQGPFLGCEMWRKFTHENRPLGLREKGMPGSGQRWRAGHCCPDCRPDGPVSSKSAAVRRMLARFDDSLWGAACGVLALFALLYAALLVGGS